MKNEELISLSRWDGMIIARLYNRSHGYYHSRRFLWYSKTDIIKELRKSGVICPKKAYQTIY